MQNFMPTVPLLDQPPYLTKCSPLTHINIKNFIPLLPSQKIFRNFAHKDPL